MSTPSVSPLVAPAPPPPWRLEGDAVVSAWLVRQDALALTPPPGWRLVRVGGRILVGVLLTRYSGGTLAYNEWAVGVAVRRGFRLGVMIPWIRVDDPRSLEGGRRFWSIPKEMARFETAAEVTSVSDAAGPLAQLRAHAGRGGGLPLFARFAVVQPDRTAVRTAPAEVSGRAEAIRADWTLAPPLPRGRPLLSLRIADLRLTIGAAEPVDDRQPSPLADVPKP